MSDNYQIGYNYFVKEDYNNAIKYFLEVADNGKKTKIAYYLGYSLFQVGEFLKSKEYSEIFFSCEPLNPINTKVLILSCISLGDIENAKKYANNYMQISQNPDEDIIRLYEKLNNKEYFSEFEFPKLNILFLQESVGIRCYKFAKALKSKGHKITVLYVNKKASDTYKGLDDSIFEDCIRINDVQQIGNICKNYDIIQCHNEPDYLTLTALSSNRPVIHDTADLISLRDVENSNARFFEGLANKLANGRIYSTIYQRTEAEYLYELKSPSLIFGNYISENDKPKSFLPKLSHSDNRIHIVYQGSISLYKHRNFIDIFITLVKQGLIIHIYPVIFNKELADFFNEIPNINYYDPITPSYLLTELTKYDVGIIPWNLELGQKRFLDSTIANKLYEYLAAGLPVITSDVKSYREYFASNSVGCVFENFENITDRLRALVLMSKKTDLTKYSLSYESEIYRLEKFYFDVIKEFSKRAIETSDLLLLNKLKNSKFLPSKGQIRDNNHFKQIKNVLFLVQVVENIGGGALTLKEIIEEFRSRGNKVFLFTSEISPNDLVEISNSVDKVFLSELLKINTLPKIEEINNLNKVLAEFIKENNIELIISFPFFMTFFIKYPVKVIYYLTYEPNFSGEYLNIKKEFILNNASKLLFINKPGINLLKSYFDSDVSDIMFDFIGIPIKDFKELLKIEKSGYFKNGVLSILIISRLAPTKSYILNVVEDVCKLIRIGYAIELTIIGEGVLKDLINIIVSYYGVNENIKIKDAMYPLKYADLECFDISIATGTTSIITSALGIPTLMAMPTLWFEYFGYFSGYAGSVGIVGYDYDYFEDSLTPNNQKYTYFEFIKSIFERDNVTSYLKMLSEISKQYCWRYENLFDRTKIVDSIISYSEDQEDKKNTTG